MTMQVVHPSPLFIAMLPPCSSTILRTMVLILVDKKSLSLVGIATEAVPYKDKWLLLHDVEQLRIVE
jgi:hypothetical protein